MVFWTFWNLSTKIAFLLLLTNIASPNFYASQFVISGMSCLPFKLANKKRASGYLDLINARFESLLCLTVFWTFWNLSTKIAVLLLTNTASPNFYASQFVISGMS
jgi:hypothetical protein